MNRPTRTLLAALARAYAASLEPPDDYYFEPGSGEDQPEEDEP